MLKPEAANRYRLRARQAQVLGMVCDGMMNKQIAEKLGIGRKTIELYISEGYRQIGVVGQREAIAKLYRERLVELPDE